MELFLKVKWRTKKPNIPCNYISIYANSKYGMQLYINKTGPLLWPRFTIQLDLAFEPFKIYDNIDTVYQYIGLSKMC